MHLQNTLSVQTLHVASSWCTLWDQTLDLGTKGTSLIQCRFLLCVIPHLETAHVYSVLQRSP